MMSLIDPSTLGKSWVLSEGKEENPVYICHNVLKNFGRQDTIVLNFLYRNYMKKLNGVILNEEEDLNPQLQVSCFLGALYNSLKNKFLVLILCPDNLIIKWHYYMSQYGKFEVKIITPSTVPEDFDQEAGIVLLLSFANLKLAEYLKEYDFFSVVIDNFDEVATKLIIRKLQGSFNIGVTSRNFYVYPDQKIQWTMLNWANTGCVGKLADFYEIDNDNFANFRDNYKEWWFRLTWNFCDTFVKPTLEEKGNLNNVLRDWGKTHNLTAHLKLKSERKTSDKKRKVKATPEPKEESCESEDSKQNKRAKKVYNKHARSTQNLKRIPYKQQTSNTKKSTNTQHEHFHNLAPSSNSSDSIDTIIYDNDVGDDIIDNLEDDEPPIGASLKNTKVSQKEFEKASLEKNKNSHELNDKERDVDDSTDENDGESSGEQLLCSLVSTKNIKLPRNHITSTKMNCQNESENFDESDLFLKSVATTSSDFTPLRNRRKAEKFFDKILEKSDDKPESKTLTQMEIELTEKEVLDVPSESDSFFKGIFNKPNLDEVKKADMYSESSDASSLNGHVDVDTLVAEVMEMVGKK